MPARKRSASPSVTLMIGGLVVGAVCALLAFAGNPGNSGLCMTGFMRDSAGALLGAPAALAGAAYLRPELMAMLVGAFGAAIASREFRPRGGASPVSRFVLGAALGLAAMVFIGCTVRVWLRVGGGDLSALPGVAGLVAGIALGVRFMKGGFHLGDARDARRAAASVTPAIGAALLVVAALLAFAVPLPVVAQTAAGVIPGGLRAPFVVSALGGLVIGVSAQRTRFCGVSGIRDSLLIRRSAPLLGVGGLLVGVVAANLALGQFRLGYFGQPLAQPDWIASAVSMGAVGLSATLLGGCPFRQTVMAASGDTDAAAALLGMVVGVVGAHYIGSVSSPAGIAPLAWYVLAGVWVALLVVAASKSGRLDIPSLARRT